MFSLLFGALSILGTLCSLGYYILCLWSARRFLQNGGAPVSGGVVPPVTVLKPLSGADRQACENLRSHCVQDCPEFEIIFGVSNPKDPVIPIVSGLIEEFPGRRIHLVVCPKILGTNVKVSNLIQMLPFARYDYLIVNDSDIRVGADYLRRIMAHFSDPGTGMVTCLYRGIAGKTLGSRLEALGISTSFAGGVLSAQQVEGGINFGLGSTLAFRRGALEAIGGFEPLVDYLADDFQLGHRTARAGFQVLLSDVIVDHYLPDYSFCEFLRHQLRWARSTRASRSWGYLGLVLTFGLPWAIFATIASRGAAWGWAALGVVLALRFVVALVLGLGVLKDRQVLGSLWLVPLNDLIALIVWIGGYTGQRIFWRGNEFILDKGKLRPT